MVYSVMSTSYKSVMGKNEIQVNKNYIKEKLIFFSGMLVFGGLFIIVYLAVKGNTTQIFTDIVNGETATYSSNKSIERNLVWLLSLFGAVVYFTFFILTNHNREMPCLISKNRDEKKPLFVVMLVFILAGIDYFVYSKINCLLIISVLYVLLLFALDKNNVILGIISLIVCVYAGCAIYRFYLYCGGNKDVSIVSIVFFSLILSIVFYIKKSLSKFFLVVQTIVPLLLLVYLASTYKYEDNVIHLHIPNKVQIFIWMLIAIFIIQAIILIKKYWIQCENVENIISHGTFISIMAFNRYSGTGAILPNDMHHPYENIITYSQMIKLGQKAFAGYIPVSGMYSFVQGFFLSFFGHGKMEYYYLTQNIFYLLVVVVIVMLLLKSRISNVSIMLIALLLSVIDYSRITFILPIMLLLSLPQLIKRKNLWLKVWFLSSFIHGLYYPVYGAAVCLGFMPLGLWQIISYVKDGELRKDSKNIRFWFWWLICLVPVVLGFPYLLGTMKHMKAMGAQTVYAEGIARFGQVVASNFLSYVQSLSIRLVVYYIFSFLIVVCIVWVSFALCLEIGNVKWVKNKLQIDNPVPAYISLSIGIAMFVAFAYTVVRLDINDIYARGAGVVYAAFAMFVVVCDRYLRYTKLQFYVLGFAVFIVAAVSGEGFLRIDYNAKLQAGYTVPDTYVFMEEDDQILNLGNVFVAQPYYDSIQDKYTFMKNIDKKESYFGIGGWGYFYLFGIKGDSVIGAGTIKGYGAAKETIETIINNKTVIGDNINSVNNYYLYYWLVTSGEYIWSAEKGMFIPNDGNVTVNEIHEQNKYINIARDEIELGRTASSWGVSMNSLSDIFTETDLSYQISLNENSTEIKFDSAIDGNYTDFVYLEFANMTESYEYILFSLQEEVVQDIEGDVFAKFLTKKDYNRGMKVIISWDDENGNSHSMNCNMGQGKLLIPLGAGRSWLLNEHLKIDIIVQRDEQTVSMPEMVDIKFLKLREIE